MPSDGILITKKLKKKGLIVCNKDGNKIIPNIYDDFYFQDSNSTVYKLFGISYSNPDKIWAKKDNKWGIIPEFISFIKNKYQDKLLRLEVEKDNAHAVHVYEKAGFKKLPYSEYYIN